MRASWRWPLIIVVTVLLVSSFLLSGAAVRTASAPPNVAAAETAAAPSPAAPSIAAPSATATRQVVAAAAPTDFSLVSTREPPTATAEPPVAPAAAGPTTLPTPTPRAPGTPWRVGVQVGHLRSHELPEELARLRTSTGARYGGVTEAELNLAIVERIKPLLEAQGVVVDVLPATVPPAYDADAFIAVHADGSTNPRARGWKAATPWRASRASQALLDTVAASYGPATGLPYDAGGITSNMRGYYAFSYRRHTHAIARTTPAIIVETGFMTSAADREILFGQPDRVARGIADGVMAYLNARDPSDGAALLPPEFPQFRSLPGAVLRTAPRDDAGVLLQISPDSRVIVFSQRDDWYEAVVRGEWRAVGWIRNDQVTASDDPLTLPTATNP